MYIKSINSKMLTIFTMKIYDITILSCNVSYLNTFKHISQIIFSSNIFFIYNKFH